MSLQMCYLNELEQLARNNVDTLKRKRVQHLQHLAEDIALPSSSVSVMTKKHPRVAEQEVGVVKREVSSGSKRRRAIKERSQHEGTTAAQAKAIYEVYTPIDNGTVKDTPVVPIV